MLRRDFVKTLSGAGAAAVGASLAGPAEAQWIKRRPKVEIGEVARVRVDVLTETSWFDNTRLKQNIVAYGGAGTNQYSIPWDWDNAGGYSALITVTTLEGETRKILLDTGWNTEWMDYIYRRNGVDRMLAEGEIDFLVISHWHLDHAWGLASALKHNPDIKIIAPGTLYPEDRTLLGGGRLTARSHDGDDVVICQNDHPHTGPLVLTEEAGENDSGIYRPMPGMAIRLFDVPILLRVRGENVLYFNVKDHGIVTVTGCCHPGLLNLFAYARRNFEDARPYGCYGGLHLTVFESWDPRFDDIIRGIEYFGIEKIACNHCTGWLFAEKAAAAGLPIVRGTDAFRDYPKVSTVAGSSNVFLTNGDAVTFG